MYIGDWLYHRELLTPDRVALLDAQRDFRHTTYREWNRNANRTANWLASLGVKQGDLVAVLAINCVEYLDVWFACGKLGAIMQTLNWRLTAHELGGLLAEATPRLLIYGPDFVSQTAAIEESVKGIEHFIALDRSAKSAPGDLDFGERDSFADSPPPPVELTWDSPWVICYTGGTTGLPKGAILTHGNITWNSINTVMSWSITEHDLTFCNMPMFHTGGLNVLTAPLVHVGGTSIICKGVDIDQIFDLVERFPISIFFGVPTIFIAMQQHPRWESFDFSKVRWVANGGAPCPPLVFEKWWAKGVEFKTGYGMTESGPNTFWLPKELVKQKPGSVGRPMFHVDVKVVRPDGSECDANEVGELLIRGPHIVPGYWHKPEESNHALRDGWLHSGDLARRDEDGDHYIVGRLKDMIISGGENIYPAEVEAAMSGHPDVVAVALIAVPDPKWGEVGKAIVVPRQGEPPDPEALLEYARERLARYKVPKSVDFIDALPVTGAGKIDKIALQKQFGPERDG